LEFIDADSIFEVVNDEDKDWRKEVYCMDDWKRKVKLCRCDRQSVDDDDDVSFEDVVKVGVVFIVQAHVVVTHNREIENHGNYASDE
jgi:hypothetical protein